MHIYIYMRRTYTRDSMLDICIAVRSCLLMRADDIYSTTNQISYYVYYMNAYIFQGCAPVEIASVIYRGKLN